MTGEELPEGWIAVRLADAVDLLQIGPFGSMLHKSDYLVGGVPLINPANIVAGRLVPDSKITIGEETIRRLEGYLMYPGDVVVARRGEMGRAALVTDERNRWFCGTGCAFLRGSRVTYPPFLAFWFGSPSVRCRLENDSVGATMSNLSTKILGNLVLGLPPLPEQKRIVAEIGVLFSQLDHVCERIGHLVRMLDGPGPGISGMRVRQAILSKAFKGELVPTQAELARAEGRTYETAAEMLERVRAAEPGTQMRAKKGTKVRALAKALKSKGAS